MKKIIVISFFCIPLNAYSINYNDTVFLDSTQILSGDKIQSKGNGIVSKSSPSNKLDLGTGYIGVTINYEGAGTNGIAVHLADSEKHNLGSGTSVYGTNSTTDKKNIIGIQVEKNTYLTANHISITTIVEEGYGEATGIFANKSTIDLGSDSSVKVKGNLNSYALNLSDSNLIATNLSLEAISGIGISADQSQVVLKGESKIDTSGFGVFLLSNGSSSFQAEKVSITTKDFYAYGINSNSGSHKIDLGNGSSINTHGDYAHAISIVGDYNAEAFKAKNITINAYGEKAMALDVRSGKIDIEGGSLTTHDDGVLVSSISQSGKKIDLTITDANLSGTGRYGVYSEGGNSNVTLKNTRLSLDRQNKPAYALFAKSNGKLFVENFEIVAAQGASAIAAESGAKVNVIGKTIISLDSASAGAISATGNNTVVTVDGLFNIQGSITASNNSKVSLNSQQNSIFTGSIIENNNGVINWKGQGTLWNVTAHSAFKELDMAQGSKVNLAYASDYATLNIDELKGNMDFTFKIDLEGQQGDLLKVNSSSVGNHNVSLLNNGAVPSTGNERLTIIETADGNANFSSEKEYEFGGFEYVIRRENNDPSSFNWEVAGTGKRSKPADASISTVIGNYLINLAEQEHLTQRMSVLRSEEYEQGVWLRSYSGKFKSFESRQLRGFNMDYSGIQLGVDGLLAQSEGDSWHLGGALGYTTSDQNYVAGAGKQKSYSATLYATYSNENSSYADFYLKYANYKNKLDIQDSLGSKVKGNANSSGVTISTEVGKRFSLHDNVYIEPSAQLTLGRISSSSIKNSNGLRVDLEQQNSAIARVGGKLGYTRMIAEQPVALYAKLNYAYEFLGEQTYKLNIHKQKLKFSGNALEYGFGVNSIINKQHSVFVEAVGSTGKRFNKYDVNFGYRYQF